MVFSNVIVDVTVPRRSSVFSQSSVQIQYNGKHYKQLHGTAMGSPVSVVVAEIVMQNIEEQALASYKRIIPLWLRYVDDTFTTLHKDEIDDFHEHLNRQNAHIQFTKEIEDNDKIPFLDCLVIRDSNRLQTTRLPLKLSKRQSMSSQTVLLRTTLTRTIVLYLILLLLLLLLLLL